MLFLQDAILFCKMLFFLKDAVAFAFTSLVCPLVRLLVNERCFFCWLLLVIFVRLFVDSLSRCDRRGKLKQLKCVADAWSFVLFSVLSVASIVVAN
jgi:hypothetical protein